MDCPLGRRLHKGDTAWKKGLWLGKSETNLEHIVGTESGALGERSEDWSRRIAQKLHCCSRYKEYLGTWYQTHRVLGDARDIRHLHQSYHQSTETRRTTNQVVEATAHLRHHQRKLRAEFHDMGMLELKLRFQKSAANHDEGECSCYTCRECVVGGDSESTFQVVHTVQASS